VPIAEGAGGFFILLGYGKCRSVAKKMREQFFLQKAEGLFKPDFAHV
jgi:hypothetical protein